MNINNTICIMACALFFISCNSTQENQEPPTETNEQEMTNLDDETELAITEPSRNSYDIELIDQKKWIVNDEMMVHIRNMEAEMLNFSEGEAKDYAAIAKTLKDHIGLLTKSCTMKGQAHDELHKWLLPFIKLVNTLKDAEEGADLEEMYLAIEESMEEFNMYFE